MSRDRARARRCCCGTAQACVSTVVRKVSHPAPPPASIQDSDPRHHSGNHWPDSQATAEPLWATRARSPVAPSGTSFPLVRASRPKGRRRHQFAARRFGASAWSARPIQRITGPLGITAWASSSFSAIRSAGQRWLPGTTRVAPFSTVKSVTAKPIDRRGSGCVVSCGMYG